MNSKMSGPFKLPFNGKKPSKLVIFLHGVGADGHDLIELSDEFSESIGEAVFLSPHAPFKYDAYPTGYQWFSLTDYTEDKLYEGIEVALPILKEYIDENLEKYQLEYKDLILIGFSQGTIMALQMAPRLPDSCFAVIGFSGALVKGKMLEPNIKSKPPIFLSHGSDDQVLPISKYHLANKSLKEMGLSVEGHVIKNLGHGINLEAIELANEFLRNKGGK